MEEVLYGKNKSDQMVEAVGSTNSDSSASAVSKDVRSSPKKNVHSNIEDDKVRKDAAQGAHLVEIETSGDVNMEALITPEDLVRAGGLGARDDIDSVLPVSGDSTDFEATILDARDYEGPQGEKSRPGLGWMEGTEQRLEK